MSDLREPPPEIELAELLAAAEEVNDPLVFRILDMQIEKRRRERDAAVANTVAQNRELRLPSPTDPAA